MYLSIISGAKEALEDFFNNIVEFFNYISDILSHIFEGTNKAIPLISNIINYLKSIIISMPTFLQVFATLSITISIIYFIINREQG